MKPIPILIIFFLGWCLISWNWYVCGIKELCEGDERKTSDIASSKVPSSSASIEPTDFLFRFKKNTVILNTSERTNAFLDSIKGSLKNKSLTIYGGYAIEESASLGRKRAQKVAAYFSDKTPILLADSLIEHPASNDYLDDQVFFALNNSLDENSKGSADLPEKSDWIDRELRVFFDSGSDQPKFEGNTSDSLRLMMDAAKKYGLALRIVGHSDNTGSYELNQGLSRQRALEAQKRAQALAPSVPISITFLGDTNPTEGNHTETGKAKNRRVELILTEQ